MLDLLDNSFMYSEIRIWMYGLPHARSLEHDRLQIHMVKYNYTSCKHTPNLWTHDSRPIIFTLFVDDFVININGQHHTDYLINALIDLYSVCLLFLANKNAVYSIE